METDRALDGRYQARIAWATNDVRRIVRALNRLQPDCARYSELKEELKAAQQYMRELRTKGETT